MKKSILVATFLAIGAGSAGVSALDNVNPMAGSDTLKDFTLSVINGSVCPAAVGLVYTGGGSGGGETALINSSNAATPTQTVAPMSRFLASPAVCSAKDASKAEAIAFAADGVGVVVSKQHIACDPNAANPTDCAPHGPTGIRNSGTLAAGTYTLGGNPPSAVVQGWRDVLRLVYLGLPNTAGKDPDANGIVAPPVRDCNSAARQDLVNTWGNMFENACSGGNCTQLNHAFRRDELSGTTDVFRELLNAKLSPFCNTRFAGDPLINIEYPTVLSNGAPVFEDSYQDFDPIRRTCAGGANGQGGALPAPTNGGTTQPDFPALVAEQVCSPRGGLGLVLPVRSPESLLVGDIYPTEPCLRGNLDLGPAPKTPGGKDTLCPNGDVPLGNVSTDYNPATGVVNNSSGVCLIPAGADNSARCINGRNNFPSPIDPPGGAIPNALRDGRVYNQQLYGTGTTPLYLKDPELATNQPTGEVGIFKGGPARSVVGALIRIHATRTMIATAPTCPGTAGSGRCCDRTDSTDAIGCLVDADPCSVGFGGGVALTSQLQTSASNETNFGASVNNIANKEDCIQNIIYPLARKVYISSVIGFENVTGQELALTKCFAGGVTGGVTAFHSLLSAVNLFPLPGDAAVCQDFPNETCTTNNVASDACANNGTVGLPTAH